MAVISISEAARVWRIARSTLQRAIREGKLSATKQANGSRGIDTAELIRVFGEAPGALQEGGSRKEDPAASEALEKYQKARAEFDALESTLAGMRDRQADVTQQISEAFATIEQLKVSKQAALLEYSRTGSDANLLKLEQELSQAEKLLTVLRERVPAFEAAMREKHPELVALESAVNQARENYWKVIEQSLQASLKDPMQAIVDCFLALLASGGKYRSFGDYCEKLCQKFRIVPGKLDSAALVPVHPVRAKITEGERSKAKYPPQSKIESRNFEGSRLIEKDGMQVFSQSIVPKTDDSLEPKGES